MIDGRVSASWKNFNTEFMERFKGYVYKIEPNSMLSISFIFVFISRTGDALWECCIVTYILKFSSSLRCFLHFDLVVFTVIALFTFGINMHCVTSSVLHFFL